MNSRLFVGGLPWSAGDQELSEAFSGFGNVTDAKVILDRETGKSRGFGFVTFATAEEAQKALEAMDGGEIGGRRVTVREAQERAGGPRGPGGPGGGPRGPGGPRSFDGPRPPRDDAPRGGHAPRPDAPRSFDNARPSPGRGRGGGGVPDRGDRGFGDDYGGGGRGKKGKKGRGGGGRRDDDYGDDF